MISYYIAIHLLFFERYLEMRRILEILFLLAFCVISSAQGNGFIVSGSVREAGSAEPLVGAVVKIDDGVIWATADLDGNYRLSVPNGSYMLSVECLGYVSKTMHLSVKGGRISIVDKDNTPASPDFLLDVESLALDDVVVTARRPAGTMGTSHSIGKEALEHLQMSTVADMSALLPGGKTVNPDLTKETAFSLRDGGTGAGNAAFGTALEVDGVRLGGNSGLGQLAGSGTRSIAVENIESIEVITGVPSAEYGDLNSGMVKINTWKGRTPVNISFSVNPRTYQTSVSKGVDLGANRGVLNVSGEWARATSKLVSPYTSYTRRTASASYTNTFDKVLRLEAGATVNIGGMDSKDDPDANAGNYENARDNVYRANASLSWMLNAPWVTTLKFEASASCNDNLTRIHKYFSSATTQPAIHAEESGYHWADLLPLSYHSDQMVDSKEINASAAAKYDWMRNFGNIKNRLKSGVQFKMAGNTGEGEYYLDPALSPNGYRPRPYSQYPFMHNLSEYVEDQATVPIGGTMLDVIAGLRFEQVFLKDSRYSGITTLSPRFNAKWKINSHLTVRGGWGVNEKLPSFWVLFPKQEYRDILTDTRTRGSVSEYEYYTVPYTLEYNPDLKWQRNSNSELGIDFSSGEWNVSAVGFYNVTEHPYTYLSNYTPFTYENHQNGITDKTFVRTTVQANGRPVYRSGAELTVDFPEIKPLRTSFRLDASYAWSRYVDDMLAAYYPSGVSHPTEKNMSYPYYAVYPRGGSGSVVNGRLTHSLDANVTGITHIPEARLVITCRLEMSILRRSMNLSEYDGAEYAYKTAGETSVAKRGGSIYNGNSYSAIWPLYYVGTDGVRHDFTLADSYNQEMSNLIIRTGNAYTFDQDGYGFYMNANLSVTKEIGKHVSLSFFANNFTASRPAVKSLATGVPAVFTPEFYYGMTCRIKI